MNITLTQIKLPLAFTLISFGLLGCEQISTSPTTDSSIVEEPVAVSPEADDIMSRFEMIKPGMTHEEVVNILGTPYRSLGNPPKVPECDTFRYLTDDGELFVVVWYEDDRVYSAFAGGRENRCAIV